jgi:hypothetical protein
MKMFTNCTYLRSRAARWTALSLLLGSLATVARADEPISPAGSWDCVISGSERGVGSIIFSEDESGTGGSLIGIEVLSPSKKGDTTDGRTSGDFGRTITTTSSGTVTNLLGFALLSGTWTYDANGRVVGVFTEGAENISCTTNQEITTVVSNVVIDNVTITVTNYFTNDVLTCVTNAITNGVSFIAKVRPTKVTIKTKGPNGNTVLKGIPAADIDDISGSYYATGKRKDNPDFTELLEVSSAGEPDFPGLFIFSGEGPAYLNSGVMLLSNQKKLGIVSVASDETIPLMSGFGGFNAIKRSGKLSTTYINGQRGSYKLTGQPVAPPPP